ncbi:MAG TPA: dihydroneopterin aldolase [Acidimicrobiales bacterium]|jgi:FolB domain-containing protein|nr:dihydroneopterin aldolase [Acidimicrobiales bacterium]
MSDVIELRELRVSAVVGVLSEERDRAQPLALDLDIERPLEEAAMGDDLTKTTNYAEVLTVATSVARDGAFLLLETLAYRVAREVLAMDDDITAVTVAVRKLRPPVPEDVATVGVRCTLSRP